MRLRLPGRDLGGRRKVDVMARGGMHQHVHDLALERRLAVLPWLTAFHALPMVG